MSVQGLQDALLIPRSTTSSDMDEIYEKTRAAAKASLYFFATAVLQWNKLQERPHLEMCNFIQRQDRSRKLLLIPRDCYKSTIISKSFPLWILIQDEFMGIPGREHRILLESFSADNASKQIRSIQQQIEKNQILQWLFPEIIPDISSTGTKWTERELLFPRDGMYGENTIEAAGVDSHIVSRHYTVQIKDDIEDKQSSESPTVRERVKSFYKSAEALFVDEQTAFDVLVGTRWGIDDVYSDIYKEESDVYDIMCRPLFWDRDMLEHEQKQAEQERRKPVWDLDPERDAPERGVRYYFFEKLFPEPSCQRVQKKQGTWMFSMLYQNNPQDPSLAEFKMQDVQFFTFNDEGDLILEHLSGEHETVAFDSLVRVLFWDPALEERDVKKNCNNAQVAMFKDVRGRLFLAQALARKASPLVLCDTFIESHRKFRIHKAAIEDAGFQRTLKFPLYQRMLEKDYRFSIAEERPIGDKDARIRSLIPYVESHLFYVRTGLYKALEEMKGFPLFPTKDILDAAAACVPLLGKARRETRGTTRAARNFEEKSLATRNATTGY